MECGIKGTVCIQAGYAARQYIIIVQEIARYDDLAICLYIEAVYCAIGSHRIGKSRVLQAVRQQARYAFGRVRSEICGGEIAAYIYTSIAEQFGIIHITILAGVVKAGIT